MRRSCLLPFALVSGLLLCACGARASLTDPGAAECGWSVRDGVPGVESQARGHFAVLGDGSVVLPISDSAGGHSLRKIDPEGGIVWNAMDGPGPWSLSGVARDAADRLVVLGTVNAGATLVLGATLTCPEKKGPCIFIGKLAETGTLTWSKVVLGKAWWPKHLAVTGDGRITVEGDFGDTIDFGCGPLTAVGSVFEPSRYLAQLSPSGECLWSRAIVGTPYVGHAGDDLAVDDEGEVALAMSLPGMLGAQTIDLGGGPVPFDTEKGTGFAVAKYAPNGDLVFAKVVSGGLAEALDLVQIAAPPVSVAVTGAGEVLLSTAYRGTFDLGGGPQGSPSVTRHFVTKLGAKGEVLWTRDVAATAVDPRGYPFSIAAEPGGDFFLAGRGEPGMTILGKTTPETTLFVAAYDAGGEPAMVQTFPLTGDAYAEVEGLEASADGALVVAGRFRGTLDFGQDPLVSEGAHDAFAATICR